MGLASQGAKKIGKFAENLIRKSDEARMADAKAMGFDTDTVYYHGGSKGLDAFDATTPERGNLGSVYVTPDKDISAHYALAHGVVYDDFGYIIDRDIRSIGKRRLEVQKMDDEERYFKGLDQPEWDEKGRKIYPLYIKKDGVFDPDNMDAEDLIDTVGEDKVKESIADSLWWEFSDEYDGLDPREASKDQIAKFMDEWFVDGDIESVDFAGADSQLIANSPSSFKAAYKIGLLDDYLDKKEVTSLRFTNDLDNLGEAETLVVRDPRAVRSVNAEFDPSKADSPNLLAGVGGVAAAGAVMNPEQASAGEQINVDVQRANDLERLLELYTQKGDKQGQLEVLREMDKMQSSITQVASESNLMNPPNDAIDADSNMNISPRGRRALESRSQRDRELNLLRQRARQSGIPLARDLKEIGAAPEMNAFNLPAFKASAGALFTFDNEEVGNILEQQLGADIQRDIEGNQIAMLPSGAYAINKAGASPQDLAKFAATGLAYTPAGRLATIPAQAAGGVATASAIELGQKSLGGEISRGDIALEAALPVVGSKVAKMFSRAKPRSPATQEYLERQIGGIEQQPSSTIDLPVRTGARPIETPSVNSPDYPTQELDLPSVNSRKPRIDETSADRVDDYMPVSITKRPPMSAFEEGTIEAAGWKLDNGRIIKDPIQVRLMKHGVAENILSAQNRYTKGDKALANNMLNRAERIIRGVSRADLDVPQGAVGHAAMKRYKILADRQNGFAKDIRQAVKNDLRGKKVDITDVIDRFQDTLADLGVEATEKGLNFRGSDITKSTNRTPIREAWERLNKSTTIDAADLHRAKRVLSDLVNYEKKSVVSKPVHEEGERAIKNARAQINQKLRQLSDNYAKANDEYSTIARTLEPFLKEMGKRFDPESTRVGDYVGNELRKVITNYAKGNSLIEHLDNLEGVAAHYGGTFDDNLYEAIVLNIELEKALGAFRKGSMKGIAEHGADVAASGSATAQAAKTLYKAGKDIVSVPRPQQEKLEILQDLRKVINQ